MGKRVLIISHLFPNNFQKEFGTFVYDQAKALLHTNSKILVINPLPFAPWPIGLLNKKWKTFSKIPIVEEFEGITVYHPRYFQLPRRLMVGFNWWFMFIGIKHSKIFKIIKEFDPQIVHSHTILPDGLCGAKFAELLNAYSITTAHGLDVFKFPHDTLAENYFTKKSLKLQNKVIPVSRYLADHINKIEDCAEKIEVIPCGFDNSKFKPSTRHKKLKNILYVGRLTYLKGISVLLDGFKKVKTNNPELTLTIIGDGPLKKDIIKYIKENNLLGIKLLGAKPHDKIPKYFRENDLLIFPSLEGCEGAPVVLHEALAAGLPIVASDILAVKETIINGENGILFECCSSKDLARKVQKLINDPKALLKIQKNSAKSVEKFSTKETSKHLQKIFKQCKEKVCVLSVVHPINEIRVFHKHVKTLYRAGYSVEFIAPSLEKSIKEAAIIKLPISKNRFMRIFRNYKAFYMAKRSRAKLIIFFSPEFIPLALKLKRSGKKIIYDVHELFGEVVKSRSWIRFPLVRNIMSKSITKWENEAGEKFDLIIGAWPKICERFSHSVCINNFPNISDYRVMKMDSEIKIFLYIGMMAEEKGVYKLIEAAHLIKNKNIKIKIIGEFNDAKFEKKVKNLPGWNLIDFLPFGKKGISSQIDEEIYCGITCNLPTGNFIESYPNKMFQYMAWGIPQIASNFKLWKKVIEKDGCGLCYDPQDPVEMVNKMIFLAENVKVAKRMGKKARQLAVLKYNWDKESKKLADNYIKVLNK